MSYLLFNADREGFDDGEGNLVSLGEHLEYVDNYCGTPDCWSSVDTDSRNKAMLEAKDSGLHLYVVDGYSYRVVGVVNKPQ